MDQNSALYAEPISSVEVDQAERRMDAVKFQRRSVVVIAVLAVLFVVLILTAAYLAHRGQPQAAAQMPAAQHQRPFESDKELRRMTRPVELTAVAER